MFVAVLLVTLNHLQAQTMQWSGQTIGVVQSAPPDSIVQVAADAQGLQQVALADLPRGGTFWYVTPGGIAAPFPCPPPDENAIIYAITDTQFLVDQTGGQVTVNTHRLGMQNTTASTVDAALSAQADAVVNLIVKIQTEDEYQQMRSMARAFGMDVPTPGDGGSYGDTNSFGYFFNYTFDTNQLWLEIMNVSNGWSGLNLHNATNQVYAIWGTTNLLGTWNVETELWPTTDQTNAMPFAIQNLDRQDLFLRAEDWTGVDSNGDGIPDWWIFKFFGDLSETSTNLDSQGNTLGYDFTNGIDPNIITFTVEAANDYVNTTTANVQLNITAGVPSFYALLVNSNPTTNWLPFTSTNLTVMLGSTDGVYNVSVGLKGLPVDATETWSDYIFTLDRTAPMVTLSTPVNGSVSKPYFQLGGLADKPVRVAYDLNNAAGTVTNENGFVTDQTYDPAQGLYTTNFFQCFDIPLATNINYLTLHVTDRAGNVATTNFTVTLDYSIATNPPVVTLIWPQDGMAVSGSNCTIRGTMSDETGSVMAQVINGDGTTNQITGLVERNGNFWLENVPLNGTNQITLQAADASGNNVTTTNFIVNPSSLNLTIDSMPTGDDLYQPYGSVSGTVSDGSATVTVNGVAATVSGNNWTATNVPISDQGTAVFDVKAQAGGNPAANGSAEQEKPAQAVMVEYSNNDDWRIDENGTNYWRWFWSTDYHRQTSDDGTLPGDFHATQQHEWNDFGDVVDQDYYEWTATNGMSVMGGYTNNNYRAGLLTSPDVDGEDNTVRHYYAHNCNSRLWTSMTITEEAHTKVKLFTGGKAKVGRQNLFQLQGYGTAYGNPQNLFWYPTPATTIPPQTLAVGGLGSLGKDGNLWLVLPDNTNVDITITAPKQNKHFDAWASPTKYHLVSRCSCPRQNFARTDVGVGEIVGLYFSQDGSDKTYAPVPSVLSASIAWKTTGGGLSVATSTCATTLTSPSNAANATVTAKVGGVSLSIGFNVLEPTGVDHADFVEYWPYSYTSLAGAGVHLRPCIGPTNVSFWRVQIMEVGEDASDVQGYFRQSGNTPGSHIGNGADKWITLDCDNNWIADSEGEMDWVKSYDWAPPWSAVNNFSGGSYTWNIPGKWKVGGNGQTNDLANGWDQVMTLSGNGTMTVKKFGHTVWRTINNVYHGQ